MVICRPLNACGSTLSEFCLWPPGRSMSQLFVRSKHDFVACSLKRMVRLRMSPPIEMSPMVVCGASKASASVRARSCAAAKQRAVQRQCGGECAACERAQPAQAEGNAHLVKVKIWPKRLNEFASETSSVHGVTCGFATERCWAGVGGGDTRWACRLKAVVSIGSRCTAARAQTPAASTVKRRRWH